jgi:hypothetical protein
MDVYSPVRMTLPVMSWAYLNVLFTSSKCQDAISITEPLTQLITSKSITVVAEKASSILSLARIKRHIEYFKNTELFIKGHLLLAFIHNVGLLQSSVLFVFNRSPESTGNLPEKNLSTYQAGVAVGFYFVFECNRFESRPAQLLYSSTFSMGFLSPTRQMEIYQLDWPQRITCESFPIRYHPTDGI